jgi:hypothetical protein
MGFTGLKSRCPAVFLQGALETLFLGFQLPEADCIPSLMAPFSRSEKGHEMPIDTDRCKFIKWTEPLFGLSIHDHESKFLKKKNIIKNSNLLCNSNQNQPFFLVFYSE